ELAAFNIPTGPSNILARQVIFTIADGTDAGPFYGIGNFSSNTATNFVYPQQIPSNGVEQSSTIIADNVTTSGTFNFTDSYLIASSDFTQNLRLIWPYP